MSAGLIHRSTTYSCDEVIERLKAATATQPMGVVAHINGQAAAARRGLDAACDQILEVFQPDFAVRVWAACKEAGLDIPIRFHVHADGGRTLVSYRPPSRVFAPYAHPELDRLGAELDPIFAAILERALSS